MSEIQQEAIRVISDAISGADGNLLPVIDSAHEKWQVELREAKSTARKLLAEVLEERETLRKSLASAADLWRTLQPAYPLENTTDGSAQLPVSYVDSFPANSAQLAAVRALHNISQTLFWAEFTMEAPRALERATTYLEKIHSNGLDKVVKGNPALLVDAHANLTAAERLRDLILLESPASAENPNPTQWFLKAVETRNLLEDIVLRGIFGNVLQLSQVNPCILVAGARVVESEEAEDQWWKNRIQKGGLEERGAAVRAFGTHDYKKRALNAIIESLQVQFWQRERELRTFKDNMTTDDNEVKPKHGNEIHVSSILDWIQQRRSETEIVRRYVTPCLPPSFEVSQLYESELHRQFMRLISQLLHLNKADGTMLLSEADLIKLTSWYSKYRNEVDEQGETIDSFLSEKDRKRLISALQQHCAHRITASISSRLSPEDHMDVGLGARSTTVSKRGRLKISKSVLCRDDLSQIVMDCVGEQVRRMLDLKMRDLDKAVAQVVSEILLDFQTEIRQVIANDKIDTAVEGASYLCATANHMAKCLGFSEELRDSFIPLGLDHHRPEIEERMEAVIDGFRSTASVALHVLIDGMRPLLEVHVSHLFAPSTGTEVILDMLAVLADYFKEYKEALLDYHFEYLAIETLKRVVVWYLVPFLRLTHPRLDESVARRFTSLPIFEDQNEDLEDLSENLSRAVSTRRSDTSSKVLSSSVGLASMSGAAVLALVEKDISNITAFMEKQVPLHQKKQLKPALEPLYAIQSLYKCDPTAHAMAEAFRDAKFMIDRALRPLWALEYGAHGQFGVRNAEKIWETRHEVNPSLILEAASMTRCNIDRVEAQTPSRMSSVDDGRIWSSRYSDPNGSFSERFTERQSGYNEHLSSSSLLWAPKSFNSSIAKRMSTERNTGS
ncbi:Exocyst complex component Sec6 [Gracilaria domingensis]|nr:Exocyst complex component Sec6 [Gracilaria domingensis]